MKVLHLISGGDTGGAKTHIISLLKGLNERIDARIICFIEDSFYEDVLQAGIPIKVFKQKSRSDLSVIDRLVEEINSTGYDIIHCHGARANFIAQFLKGRIKKPFLTTMHSDYKLDFKDNFYKRLVYTTLNTIALRRFDNYIVVTDAFRNMMMERGFHEDRIFVCPNGIDMSYPENFINREDYLKGLGVEDVSKPVAGILARLEAIKDHRTFINAAKEALKKKDMTFIIGGDGAEELSLKAYVNELGLEDNIKFAGFVEDPYSFFNTVDINVLTSISEGFPYVILEGARMKKPVVTTQVGGIDTLVKDGVNGYLTEPGDWKTIGERIADLASDSKGAKQLGERLYEDASLRFSYDAMAETHVEIYNRILVKNPKVVMSGYFGFDNSGDDAILKAIVKDLRSKDPYVSIKVLSKDPEKTRELCPVFSANRFSFKEVLSSIKEADILISGGGSLLQDVTSTRSLLYYLTLMTVAQIMKKKVIVYANGIGPIQKNINRILTRWVLNRTDVITLRDNSSYEYIKEIGVKNSNVFVTADPVFTLEAANVDRVNEIYTAEGIKSEDPVIGISVRNWKNEESIVKSIATSIKNISEKTGAQILLIPMHYPEDLGISKEIRELSNTEKCNVLEGKYSVEEIMGIISTFEIMAAMRLHSLIYAATQEIPSIGIVYDPKVEGFLREIGSEYSVDVDTINEVDFTALLTEVWDNRVEIKDSIAKHKKRLTELAYENVDQVFKLLGR